VAAVGKEFQERTADVIAAGQGDPCDS
jgi:hypothetical protein